MKRAFAGVLLAAVAVFILARSPGQPAAPRSARLAGPAASEQLGSTPLAIPRFRSAAPATPVLPGQPPFREQDLAVTTDMPDGAVIVLQSSARIERDLVVELATREPLPEGKRVFTIVSVSDALGNTVMDCTWRDIELTDEPRKLECELPAGVALPLAISAHQLPGPSFVEAPVVVAIDHGAHL